MKRRSRTIAQQCRYYKVDSIFENMVSVYLNGNISDFGELFKELNRRDRKEFIPQFGIIPIRNICFKSW